MKPIEDYLSEKERDDLEKLRIMRFEMEQIGLRLKEMQENASQIRERHRMKGLGDSRERRAALRSLRNTARGAATICHQMRQPLGED